MTITIPRANRHYLSFNAKAGYPAGALLYYECGRCGIVVPSQPDDSAHCECRNIMIDVDYGRFSVEDPEQVRLFEIEPAV
jgi:hypothetical protein